MCLGSERFGVLHPHRSFVTRYFGTAPGPLSIVITRKFFNGFLPRRSYRNCKKEEYVKHLAGGDPRLSELWQDRVVDSKYHFTVMRTLHPQPTRHIIMRMIRCVLLMFIIAVTSYALALLVCSAL